MYLGHPSFESATPKHPFAGYGLGGRAAYSCVGIGWGVGSISDWKTWPSQVPIEAIVDCSKIWAGDNPLSGCICSGSEGSGLKCIQDLSDGGRLLFTQIFVDQFGYTSCLKRIFWGTALLCGAIAVCAFVAPDLVWIGSDFNPIRRA